MSKQGFALLQDVIMDPDFPDLDLALRRGRHVDRDDATWYALLSDAQELLEPFYRRYGCELIHKTDGYYYLLPTGEKLSRRQLAVGDMLVGQALALMYLDPAVMQRAGVVTHEELVAQLSSVLGTDALIAAYNPKRKRHDERIAHKNVRSHVAQAVRRLAALGFVELGEGDQVRLRPALLRFAEPVRASAEPAEALAKLAAKGEVAFIPEEYSTSENAGWEYEGGESEELDDAADDGDDAVRLPAAARGGRDDASAWEDEGDAPRELAATPMEDNLAEGGDGSPSVRGSHDVATETAWGDDAGRDDVAADGGDLGQLEIASGVPAVDAHRQETSEEQATDEAPELSWDDVIVTVPRGRGAE
jgi:chromosome partition protein MukE